MRAVQHPNCDVAKAGREVRSANSNLWSSAIHLKVETSASATIAKMTEEETVDPAAQQARTDWAEEVRAAQGVKHFRIEGADRPRVPYGSEHRDWKADELPCHDCGAVKGQLHVAGCDVEECPQCGQQAISCACEYDELEPDTFDFQRHRDSAVGNYLLTRPLYEQFSGAVKRILEEAIARRGIRIHSVQARAKDPKSFGEKTVEPSPNRSIPTKIFGST